MPAVTGERRIAATLIPSGHRVRAKGVRSRARWGDRATAPTLAGDSVSRSGQRASQVVDENVVDAGMSTAIRR